MKKGEGGDKNQGIQAKQGGGGLLNHGYYVFDNLNTKQEITSPSSK